MVAQQKSLQPLHVLVSHLHHAYPFEGQARPVLKDVNFEVKPGEFVVLLGPSGCGKSTLLRLVAGLEEPSEGRVEADGKSIMGPGPDRIIMFQDPTLFPWRTVEGNVALGLDIQRCHEPDRVRDLLQRVGLAKEAQLWPHQLSGGMAQRVALARALVNNPRLLILDEPLGKLDSLTRLTMQTEIRHIWQERGFSALMVTHDVEEALLLATRIIVFSARPARVLSNITVDLPSHRHRGDARIIELRHDILRQLGHSDDW